MRVAHDEMCTVHVFGVYLHSPKMLYRYFLSFNFKRIKMPKNHFDVDNGVAIDVDVDVLP